jgi:hypothetical protein
LSASDTIGANLSRRESEGKRKKVSRGAIETSLKDGQLTRREMLQRLLAGVGARAAWPLASAAHPIRALLRKDALLDEAEKLGAADWKPLFLDQQQDESLSAMAERIVPGSTKAQVNRFIDLLLNVETSRHKSNFVEALAALEAESQKRFGRRFPSLNASEQDLLLTDAAIPRRAEDPVGGAEKQEQQLHRHFENLKEWISGAYYSSEIGMRELGWTEDRVFTSFPGCEHPEGHH